MKHSKEGRTKLSSMDHSAISFHAIRAKFQQTHHIQLKKTMSVEALKPLDKFENPGKKIINSITKRSKTAPSLWSSNSSTEDNDEEEESMLNHHPSSRSRRVVPRTGSFLTDLSKRLAQSEKKDEPVSQIIPQAIPSSRRNEILLSDEYSVDAIDTLSTSTSIHYNSQRSVPTSNSSPSLHVISTIRRSTTGTSVNSIESTSNSSISTSQSTLSKRSNWHYSQFSQWFNIPPISLTMTSSTTTTTLNDDPCSEGIKEPDPSASLVRRKRVIHELIDTERSYLTDMELVKDIYYDSAHLVFNKHEIKLIFINLLDIIAFEKQFIDLLETANQNDQMIEDNSLIDPKADLTIGRSFSMMMTRMEIIYADYCKRHEDAACKIQESTLQPEANAYYKECKEKIQGKTMCWDLPSLLIKPVQRILKYPLLLREITAFTPEDHPDYDQLTSVTMEIQKVADHINEIKRRKDMVEQLIGEKKRLDRNVVQGINKRFTRRVHRKKQTSTQDSQFEVLYKRFEGKQDKARQLEKEIQEWYIKIKKHHKTLSDIVDSLEAVYDDSDGISLRSIQAFKKLAIQSAAGFMEAEIQHHVFDRIESYLKLFKNPMQIIHKRNRKCVDYDRAQHILSKGDTLDKQLQSSVEAYISLNAHLLEELPAFLLLADKYFDIIIDEFTRIQSNYWYRFEGEWRALTIELPFGKEHTWSSIEVDYIGNMKKLDNTLKGLYSKPKEDYSSSYSLQRISSMASFMDDQ